MALGPGSSLDDVRRFVADVAESLDPKSRYVPELLAIVDASHDLAELMTLLAQNSRGARHAGAGIFLRPIRTVGRWQRCAPPIEVSRPLSRSDPR